MALKKEKFEKYLKIENNTVYTKVPAVIRFDLTEYKNINEEFDIEDTSENNEDSTIDNNYEIPGFFTLEFPEEGDSIQFYFPYNIFIISNDQTEESSKELTFKFNEDDPIFFVNFKKEETNIKVLQSLFENGVKYLSNDLSLLIYNIWKQLNATLNIPWQHIELIVTQLYGVYEDNQWIPVRLSKNATYSRETAMNTKQSAH